MCPRVLVSPLKDTLQSLPGGAGGAQGAGRFIPWLPGGEGDPMGNPWGKRSSREQPQARLGAQCGAAPSRATSMGAGEQQEPPGAQGTELQDIFPKVG